MEVNMKKSFSILVRSLLVATIFASAGQLQSRAKRYEEMLEERQEINNIRTQTSRNNRPNPRGRRRRPITTRHVARMQEEGLLNNQRQRNLLPTIPQMIHNSPNLVNFIRRIEQRLENNPEFEVTMMNFIAQLIQHLPGFEERIREEIQNRIQANR